MSRTFTLDFFAFALFLAIVASLHPRISAAVDRSLLATAFTVDGTSSLLKPPYRSALGVLLRLQIPHLHLFLRSGLLRHAVLLAVGYLSLYCEIAPPLASFFGLMSRTFTLG